mgnify:FL=1
MEFGFYMKGLRKNAIARDETYKSVKYLFNRWYSLRRENIYIADGTSGGWLRNRLFVNGQLRGTKDICLSKHNRKHGVCIFSSPLGGGQQVLLDNIVISKLIKLED